MNRIRIYSVIAPKKEHKDNIDLYEIKSETIDLDDKEKDNFNIHETTQAAFDILDTQQIIFSSIDNEYRLHDDIIKHFNTLGDSEKVEALKRICFEFSDLKNNISQKEHAWTIHHTFSENKSHQLAQRSLATAS